MGIRLSSLMLLVCMACQTGLLPCSKPKAIHARKVTVYKAYHESAFSSNARNLHSKNFRSDDDRSIQNISVEEWDCPHPGQKKYMPKSVKENIRNNMKKVKSSGVKSDSTIVLE